MNNQYNIQELSIPLSWKIKRNVFYNIDPTDNIPEVDKYDNIYCQEDLLWIMKEDYNIDLGWYGSDNFKDENTGFYLHLYKGLNWNNCELLAKIYSKNKSQIVESINSLIQAIETDYFKYLSGYTVNDNNQNSFSDFKEYKIKK